MDLAAAVLRLAEANGLTASNVRDQISKALRDLRGSDPNVSNPYRWLVDLGGSEDAGWLVYEQDGKLYRCDYAITAQGKTRSTSIKISKSVEVMPRTVYDVAGGTISESATQFCESVTWCDELPLTESAAKSDYLIKVIAPGKGSSAIYPAEVLERDGPKVFRKGTHMYWNHPTERQEAERPEGDLRDLAAVLTTNAYWDGSGPKGPGLYARAKVFPDFAERIESIGPHIGVSIRAWGESEQTKAGPKLKSFTRAESVDFVTKPGAGGAVLMTESAKTEEEKPEMDKTEIQAMILEAVKPLQSTIEAQTKTIEALGSQNATQARTIAIAEAKAIVTEALSAEKLPMAAKTRIANTLASAAPLTEAGLLDVAKLTEQIKESVKAEAEYIASIAPAGVTGMGAPMAVKVDESKSRESRIAEAKRWGMNDAAAMAYATGR